MGANGPLLASGGRGVNGTTEGTVGYPNDLFLWVSRDGMGLEWEKFSLTYLHNSLLPPKLASVHPAAIACKATHHPPGCVSSPPVLAPLNCVCYCGAVQGKRKPVPFHSRSKSHSHDGGA